jgi:polyphenol oxidase
VAVPLAGGATAHVVFTTRDDGDLRVAQPPEVLAERRAEIVDLPWTYLHQVHGADVVVVDTPGQHAGVDADAAVTRIPGAALAIHTADCVPLALLADEGVVGAVHAGWRGVEAGVVEATVAAMRALGADPWHIQAVVGACIHPECYEFGADDLDRLAARYGDVVRGTTSDGAPAADMPAAVTAALHGAGIDRVDVADVCTCAPHLYSHRVRGDVGRQAMVVWIEP